MTDRELLELAAKAAGMDGWEWEEEMQCIGRWKKDEILGPVWQGWSPLADDGDALRLACRKSADIFVNQVTVRVEIGRIVVTENITDRDKPTATRRAIVRAAAEIGRGME